MDRAETHMSVQPADNLTWRDVRSGLVAAAPLASGVVAYGLPYGVLARQAGLSLAESLLMSAFVFAGSSQFVAVGMWATASGLTIILATLVVNLRHMLMGASIAPYLREQSTPMKMLLSAGMVDEAYALAIQAYEEGRGSSGYFLGTSIAMWLAWLVSGAVGMLLGSAISDPARYGLDLVFPLAFMGLLATMIDSRTGLIVALVAGLTAVVGMIVLPGTWYVIIAGLLGATLGLLIEGVQTR
jgi:4-azaleucine resistance transporter AzlC